jgi:hypothetical protein
MLADQIPAESGWKPAGFGQNGRNRATDSDGSGLIQPDLA